MAIGDFDWDDSNRDHIARHGVTPEEAEQAYMLGVLLEKKHYFGDALGCYKEASRLAPGKRRYVDGVKAFLVRYKME